jgi:hypothetical protein
VSAVDNFDLPLMAFGGKLGRLHDLGSNPVAEFIDPIPDWGIKSTPA